MTLIILSPLLLSIMMLVFATYFLLKADAVARHICRAEVLKAQKSAAESLNALLNLNKEALALRIRRKAAEAMVASGQPHGIAALQTITIQQMAFGKAQRALVLKGKQTSHLAPNLILLRIKSALTKTAAMFGANNFIIDGQSISAKFDLVTIPPLSLTPNYDPSILFREKQEMRLTWRFKVFSIMPSWLVKYLGPNNLTLKGDCAGTLEKGVKWEPRLKMTKLSQLK